MRPRHPLLRQLYTPLMAEAQLEVIQTMKVAVMLASGCSRAEIADKLDMSSQQVRAAIARLQTIGHQLEREDERPVLK